MAMLDVFKADAFSTGNLTAAINKLPHAPSIIGDMNIFEPRPITGDVAFVEDRQGTLSLLNSAARGSTKDVYSRPQRTVRNFIVPHIPYYGQVLADDVLNIRAFGQETELEMVADVVNDALLSMRRDHEATQEFHRVKALQGSILDGDASTVILNLFTAFGQTQNTVDINFATPDNIKGKCVDIHRLVATALGMAPYRGIVAMCGDTYFDALVESDEITTAYDRLNDSEYLRVAQLGPGYSTTHRGFAYGDIFFMNYRGSVGGTAFVPATEAHYFPVGVPGLYIDIIAPADFVETVGTRGQRFYAKQQMMDFDKGVELHTQSNVLPLCTRPDVLIKSTGTFS